jgi:hypothetical protein
MSNCNDVQEKIARDESLSEADRAHTIACESCASVIADFSLLEATLSRLGAAVPAGFADRVMAGVAAEGRRATRTARPARPWVPLTLAYAAGVLAAVNVAGLVGSVFAASVAFGGTP